MKLGDGTDRDGRGKKRGGDSKASGTTRGDVSWPSWQFEKRAKEEIGGEKKNKILPKVHSENVDESP